jgi:hypothetical protein
MRTHRIIALTALVALVVGACGATASPSPAVPQSASPAASTPAASSSATASTEPSASASAAAAGSPSPINGKGLVRNVPGAGILATSSPRFMFVTVRSPGSQLPGRIDVIDIQSGLRKYVNAFRPGTQSIEARGATVVMDYFRE